MADTPADTSPDRDAVTPEPPAPEDAPAASVPGRYGQPGGWTGLPPGARSAAAWSAVLLLTAAAIALIGFVAVSLAPLTLALAATLFLAALLEPVASGLRRLRLPESLAALGGVLVLIAAVVGPVWLAWRVVAAEFDHLKQRIEDGLQQIRDFVASEQSPISPEQLDSLAAEARSWLAANTGSLIAGARSAIEIVGATLLVFVLLFFVLKDGRRMWTWTLNRMPPRRQADVGAAAEAAWFTITRYVRGTAIIAAIDATGIGLALVILRVPLAVPLSLLVFVGSFVPIIGATVTGALAALVALAANGPLAALLVVAAVIIVQQTEGNLLEPLIMKRQVRLHPVVILVVVTAGALAWGVAGAFVAVPLAAVIYRVGVTLRQARPSPADPAIADADTTTPDTTTPDTSATDATSTDATSTNTGPMP